ncbi:hypothetical protein Tco_0883785 [Tanacetum coccineum]
MNERAKDLEHERLKKKVAEETPKKEDTAKVPAKVDVTKQGTKKRKGGHMKMIARKRKRPQPNVDSNDEHRECLKIVTFEGEMFTSCSSTEDPYLMITKRGRFDDLQLDDSWWYSMAFDKDGSSLSHKKHLVMDYPSKIHYKNHIYHINIFKNHKMLDVLLSKVINIVQRSHKDFDEHEIGPSFSLRVLHRCLCSATSNGIFSYTKALYIWCTSLQPEAGYSQVKQELL